MARGDPAQSEEGRLDPGLVEQGEHRVGVALDAARERLPRVAGDHRLEGADLEPVLDIDGEGVLHRPSRLRGVGAVSRFLSVLDPVDEQDRGRGEASPPAPRRAPRARRCGARARDPARQAIGCGAGSCGTAASRAERSGSTFSSRAGCGRRRRRRPCRRRPPRRRRRRSARRLRCAAWSISRWAELVDPARNAAAVAVDRLERGRRRNRDCPASRPG